MTNNRIRVSLEIRPMGKKVVAVAPDWPGLARGAKSEVEAIERLRSYIPRYSKVAKLADMNTAFMSGTSTWSSGIQERDQLILGHLVRIFEHWQAKHNDIATLIGVDV